MVMLMHGHVTWIGHGVGKAGRQKGIIEGHHEVCKYGGVLD